MPGSQYDKFYGLNVCISSDFTCCNPNTQMICEEEEAAARWFGHEDWSIMNGITVPTSPRELFTFSPKWVHSKNMAYMDREIRYQQISVFQYLDLELLNLK